MNPTILLIALIVAAVFCIFLMAAIKELGEEKEALESSFLSYRIACDIQEDCLRHKISVLQAELDSKKTEPKIILSASCHLADKQLKRIEKMLSGINEDK
jgi:hypothetical protein